MRIAFIADGRAEHTRRWLKYFQSTDDEILLLSTHPCMPIAGIEIAVLPGLFQPGTAFLKSSEVADQTSVKKRSLGHIAIQLGIDRKIQPLWSQLKTLDVIVQAIVAQKRLKQFQPDVVHAIRIQNEGYVAALVGHHPWILSMWGQDIVYFANHYLLHRLLTRWTLRFPDALTADCARDIHLAHQWGFPTHAPTYFFPGNGGVDQSIFAQGVAAANRQRTVVYPRGIGPYVRIETLLRAINIMSQSHLVADVRFVILVPQAAVARIQVLAGDIIGRTDADIVIAPFMDQKGLATLLQEAAVMVSPAISDGTPNCLLEAMACGTFPVIGDIESIREWITHGENGLLFDPENAQALADCLWQALDDSRMRDAAQAVNLELIQGKANYHTVMPNVRAMYMDIVNRTHRLAPHSIKRPTQSVTQE